MIACLMIARGLTGVELGVPEKLRSLPVCCHTALAIKIIIAEIFMRLISSAIV